MSNDKPVGWLDVVVADLVEDLLEVGDGLPCLLLQILTHSHNMNMWRHTYFRKQSAKSPSPDPTTFS